MIEKADIDAVLVLSPDQYHGEYAKKALECGKHVFIEKPVTLCPQELEELIELKKQHPQQNRNGRLYAPVCGPLPQGEGNFE